MNKYQLIEYGLKLNEIADLEELSEEYKVWREEVLLFERESAAGTRLKC